LTINIEKGATIILAVVQCDHLKTIGMGIRYDVWVPHILSDKHLKNSFSLRFLTWATQG